MDVRLNTLYPTSHKLPFFTGMSCTCKGLLLRCYPYREPKEGHPISYIRKLGHYRSNSVLDILPLPLVRGDDLDDFVHVTLADAHVEVLQVILD